MNDKNDNSEIMMSRYVGTNVLASGNVEGRRRPTNELSAHKNKGCYLQIERCIQVVLSRNNVDNFSFRCDICVVVLHMVEEAEVENVGTE